MLDLVIRNGEVVDGSGSPRYRADIGVSGGRIVAVGAISERGRRVIDGSDLIVAPGFIDIHTHYDAQAFWDSTLSPSPLHGVTTVVGGNCGFSVAPLIGASSNYVMQMLSRVEGMPVEALECGVPWDWRTTEDFLHRFAGGLTPNTMQSGQRPHPRRFPLWVAFCSKA
jgi:N-acyl-D-aspartate/D-glutamate deacylase